MSKQEEAYTPDDFELKPPEPIDDPIELRDAIAHDYLESAKRRGGEVSYEDCKRLAADDLRLVDSAQPDIDRMHDHAAAKPERKPEPVITEPTPLQTVTLERRACDDSDNTRIGLDIEDMPNVTEERKLKLVARLMQICEPVNATADTADCSHLAYPLYAKEIVRNTINCEQGLREYRGKSIMDRRRMLLRAYEDIADRSRRDLGPWWVR